MAYNIVVNGKGVGLIMLTAIVAGALWCALGYVAFIDLFER